MCGGRQHCPGRRLLCSTSAAPPIWSAALVCPPARASATLVRGSAGGALAMSGWSVPAAGDSTAQFCSLGSVYLLPVRQATTGRARCVFRTAAWPSVVPARSPSAAPSTRSCSTSGSPGVCQCATGAGRCSAVGWAAGHTCPQGTPSCPAPPYQVPSPPTPIPPALWRAGGAPLVLKGHVHANDLSARRLQRCYLDGASDVCSGRQHCHWRYLHAHPQLRQQPGLQGGTPRVARTVTPWRHPRLLTPACVP